MSSSRIHVAPLTQALCAAAGDLIARVISSVEYYSPNARAAEIAKYTADRLAAMIRRDTESVLTATLGTDLVGFCITTYDDGLIWLAWFGVDRAARARGIGAALLDAAIVSVKERGCHKIWCDTRTTNTQSKSVLTRAGFHEICTLRNHWYGHDFILWERLVQ